MGYSANTKTDTVSNKETLGQNGPEKVRHLQKDS